MEVGYDARLCSGSPQTSSSTPLDSNSNSGALAGPDTQNITCASQSPACHSAGCHGEGDGSLSPKQSSTREVGIGFARKFSTRSERRSLRARDFPLPVHSFAGSETVEHISSSLPGNLSPSLPIPVPTKQSSQRQSKLSPPQMPATSYSSSEDGHPFSVGDEDDDEFFDTQEDVIAIGSPVRVE